KADQPRLFGPVHRAYLRPNSRINSAPSAITPMPSARQKNTHSKPSPRLRRQPAPKPAASARNRKKLQAAPFLSPPSSASPSRPFEIVRSSSGGGSLPWSV